jgi:uncharacterized phiE125 gp8 family phage protein
MRQPVLKTAPGVTPISLGAVKLHCRVDHADEDSLLASLIEAAVSHLDGWAGVLGRCLIDQTWTQEYRIWGGGLALPFSNVSTVAVSYRNSSGDLVALDEGLYELVQDARGSVILWRDDFDAPTLYDDTDAPITVEMVAGYGAAPEAVPAPIRTAMMLLIGHWYANREAGGSTDAVDALIAPYRRVGL